MASSHPGADAIAQRGGGQFPGRHQPGRLAAAERAGVAPLHAGRLHRVRAARAGQRIVPDHVPARGDTRRRDRARQRHARRQRGIRHRSLRSAHRRAAEIHLRAVPATIPRATPIRATLPMPVPEGGIGRVLIYKTYKDPRTYMMNGKDIVWVRSLSGLPPRRRPAEGLRVHLVERRRADDDDGRRTAEARVRQPERPGQPRHDSRAADDQRTFTPAKFDDMFFDDIKTTYDLDAPETGRIAGRADLQRLPQGGHARGSIRSSYLPLAGSEGRSISTRRRR